MPSTLALVLAFGAVWQTNAQPALSISTIFVSLSVSSLLITPIFQLLFAVPNFVSCLGCLERIQEFVGESE
jgi:ABC-type bacteriocin/lantibiotic exporter with double-glycine peptidase domain